MLKALKLKAIILSMGLNMVYFKITQISGLGGGSPTEYSRPFSYNLWLPSILKRNRPLCTICEQANWETGHCLQSVKCHLNFLKKFQ